MGGFARYAVYYAPPAGGDLWRFGCDWLGWDAETGEARAMPEPLELPASRGAITAAPRRYGFHATLKPPIRLAEGRTPAAFRAAVAAMAARLAPFEAPALRFHTLGPFAALTPSAPSAALRDLAAACVADLDDFRAPPDAAELARRNAAGLTPVQTAHLARWGYPYVMDEFRFHLTLSGPLPAAALEALGRALAPGLAPLCAQPLPVREVAIFGDPGEGRPFRLLERIALGAAAEAPTDARTDARTDASTDASTDGPTAPPTDAPTDAPTSPSTDAPTAPPTDTPTGAARS